MYEQYFKKNYPDDSDEEKEIFMNEIRVLEKRVFQLLSDEKVCRYILKSWVYTYGKTPNEYEIGHLFDIDKVVTHVKGDLVDVKLQMNFRATTLEEEFWETVEKDVGAINLWNEFSTYADEEGIQEFYTWAYVLAFIGFKVARERLVIIPFVKKNEEKILKEKVSESAIVTAVSSVFDLSGLGAILKLDDWEAKRRQEKWYRELKDDIWENPFDLIMEQVEFKQLREISMKKATENIFTR